jgi:Queuosine salvage protein
MWACLKRAIENGVPLWSGELLAALTLSDLQELFSGESQIPMAQERCSILQEVGSVLCKHYDGRFQNMLAIADGKAFGERGLVTQLIKHFPSFRDESQHRNTGVCLQFQALSVACNDVSRASDCQ